MNKKEIEKQLNEAIKPMDERMNEITKIQKGILPQEVQKQIDLTMMELSEEIRPLLKEIRQQHENQMLINDEWSKILKNAPGQIKQMNMIINHAQEVSSQNENLTEKLNRLTDQAAGKWKKGFITGILIIVIGAGAGMAGKIFLEKNIKAREVRILNVLYNDAPVKTKAWLEQWYKKKGIK